MSITIGSEHVPVGESTWTSVRLATDADGTPIKLQVYVVNGAKDGTTLWIQGAVHGNEPVGGLAIRDFSLNLRPENIRGTVIALPVANPSAFANKQRGTTVFHVGTTDVNGTFPGSPDGPFSAQHAHALFSMITEHADVVVDAHSADTETVIHPGFVYAPDTNDEVYRRTRKLAAVTGFSHIIELPVEEMDGFLVAALAEVGIPSLMVESGTGFEVFDWAYDQYVESFRNIISALDILPRAPLNEGQPTFHDDIAFIRAHQGGFVDMAVTGGDVVDEGEPMGEISSVRGETVETIEAPFYGHVLAVRSFPTARPGDVMAEMTPS